MAGVKLHLATSKVWNYFFENIDRLQDNEDCIAEDPESGLALYLTASTIFPQLVVYAGDKAVLYKLIRNEEECSKWAVYLIMRFVANVRTDGAPEEMVEEKTKIIDLPTTKSAQPSKLEGAPDDEEDEEYQQMIDTIYEREDELTKAMGDFLAVVLCEEDYSAVVEGYGEKMINECVDDFLQYLFDNHMVSIYRPTLDVDEETGCEVLKEYPYGWGEEYEVK